MTINGPAPMMLAFFLNAADRPAVRAVDPRAGRGGRGERDASTRATPSAAWPRPRYQGELPDGNDGLGLAAARRRRGDEVLPRDVYERIRATTLQPVRGTVQADILKEDQAQNTCIFSTEFALRMMGDMQQYFIEREVRNFYSVSISGYHIAEAGREPDHAARVHAGQRLHLRRVLPVARHAHRRLRAQPVVLLLQRHGPRVRGDRPRGAPHLGQGDEAALRRQRPLAEAQVPHPDLRPQPARAGDRLQRHPHHAAGALRPLRQLQLAAHQRLRRGDHHAHRGERAPRDGDPADHQPGARPGRATRTRCRARSSSRS